MLTRMRATHTRHQTTATLLLRLPPATTAVSHCQPLPSIAATSHCQRSRQPLPTQPPGTTASSAAAVVVHLLDTHGEEAVSRRTYRCDDGETREAAQNMATELLGTGTYGLLVGRVPLRLPSTPRLVPIERAADRPCRPTERATEPGGRRWCRGTTKGEGVDRGRADVTGFRPRRLAGAGGPLLATPGPWRWYPSSPPPLQEHHGARPGGVLSPTIHFASRWGREERGCAGSPNVAPALLQTTRPQRGAAPVPGEGPPPISHLRKSVGCKEKLLSAVVTGTGPPPPSPHERRHPPRHAPSSLACR